VKKSSFHALMARAYHGTLGSDEGTAVLMGPDRKKVYTGGKKNLDN
jgi:hypothetical protein